MENDRCCGTCEFHRYYDGEWICCNVDSDNNGLETAYDDRGCYDWEGRQ